jgi:hypothetical protein
MLSVLKLPFIKPIHEMTQRTNTYEPKVQLLGQETIEQYKPVIQEYITEVAPTALYAVNRPHRDLLQIGLRRGEQEGLGTQFMFEANGIPAQAIDETLRDTLLTDGLELKFAEKDSKRMLGLLGKYNQNNGLKVFPGRYNYLPEGNILGILFRGPISTEGYMRDIETFLKFMGTLKDANIPLNWVKNDLQPILRAKLAPLFPKLLEAIK